MRKNKFAVISACLLSACLAQGQDAPADSQWDADPVEEAQTPAAPTAPGFQDVDAVSTRTAVPLPPAPASAAAPAKAKAQKREVAAASGDSDPDYSKENRFHNIYKKYNEQPTSVESWEKALGMRQAETYRVQKGDTLWDISSTLFGDSHFWPKVWSLNKGSILNPHEINPAMAIQFFAGDMQDAPTLELASADTVQKDVKTIVVDTGDGNKEVLTMPPAKRTTPVLKHLPNSIPQYTATIVQKDPKIQMDLRPNVFPTAPEYLGYYLSDVPVAGAGTVSGTEIDGKTAAEYQYIYVTMNGTPEKNYVVEKNVGKVPDPSHKNRFGQMVEYQAEIEIMERVNSEKNIYRALVTKTITPLEVGAVVVPGRIPVIDPTATPVTSGVGGKIIGGQYEKNRALFGSTALIFLDAGSQQGLQLGQSLHVIADEKLRNKKTPVQINERVIGTAKIVRLSPGFATAYVTRSTNDIMTGDFVGTTQSHASAAPVDSNGDTDLEKEFDTMPEESAPSSESGSDEDGLEL